MGPSTYTPTADGTRAALPGTSWKAKRSRRRPAPTSAPTARSALSASPRREAWPTSKGPPSGLRSSAPGRLGRLRELRGARLLPDGLQAHALLEHLGRVARGRLVEGAGVALQGRFLILQAPVVVAQDLRADVDVDLGVEQSLLAAV